MQRQKSLFTRYRSTVHAFKNIKNGSHDTIHTFKNYFTIVIFNFNKNKFNPKGPYDSAKNSFLVFFLAPVLSGACFLNPP